MLLALALSLACAPEEGDAEVYLRLIQLPHPDLETHIAECGGLADADLRGECQLAIARRAAADGGEPPEARCGLVGEGLWREECYFRASEDWNQRGDEERAAALCRQAGALRSMCTQHLWQEPLRALLSPGGSARFGAALAAAERLYEVWKRIVGEEEIASHFWRTFYETGFALRGGFRLSDCDALSEARRAPCREAGALQYVEIVRHRGESRMKDAFCAMEGSADAADHPLPQLRAEPAPELDVAIARVQAELCSSAP